MQIISKLAYTLLFAAGFRGEEAQVSDVLDLTKDNFTSAIAEHKLIMVEFFAPWCGHCKSLAPKYEIAATSLKETPIKLAKVDCTEHEALCTENGVQGFPTLKVFNEGVASPYEGEREAEGIVSFMKKQALPTITTLDESSFTDFSTSDKVVIVGFFDDVESKEYAAFESVAKKLRNDFVFGSIASKDLAKKESVEYPGVVVYKKFDEGKNVHAGELTEETLSEFVKTSSTPLIADLSPNNYSKYMEAKKPLAYIFVESEEDRTKYDAELKDMAKEHHGKINFVFINATLYGRHSESLNLKAEFPAFAIQEIEPEGKFPLDQSVPLTSKSIIEHVTAYTAGTLEPSLKSAPIPESNNGSVIVAVGKNFNDIALNKEKDVLVEIYAPWCGHCKALAPIYEEVGDAYTDNDGIDIVKFDATENDLPYGSTFSIQGFPTLKLFKAKTNEIVDFEGERTFDGITEFLKANAVNNAEHKAPVKKEAEADSEESPEDAEDTDDEDKDEL